MSGNGYWLAGPWGLSLMFPGASRIRKSRGIWQVIIGLMVACPCLCCMALSKLLRPA